MDEVAIRQQREWDGKNLCVTLDVSNKVAATSRFDTLRYLTLSYGRHLRTTMSQT